MTQAFITVPLSRMSGSTIKPSEYINFAIRDLVEDDSRAVVNSIGNIKRAIDCQLDVLLENYGLLKLSTKQKWSYPKKIEIIRKIGHVSPRILKVINSIRNKLEHEHRQPSKEKVIEFLGIAELFVELFKSLTNRNEVLIDYANHFGVWMDTKEDIIYVFYNSNDILESGGVELFRINIKEEKLKPVQSIPISDLDSWIEACSKYFKTY